MNDRHSLSVRLRYSASITAQEVSPDDQTVALEREAADRIDALEAQLAALSLPDEAADDFEELSATYEEMRHRGERPAPLTEDERSHVEALIVYFSPDAGEQEHSQHADLQRRENALIARGLRALLSGNSSFSVSEAPSPDPEAERLANHMLHLCGDAKSCGDPQVHLNLQDASAIARRLRVPSPDKESA